MASVKPLKKKKKAEITYCARPSPIEAIQIAADLIGLMTHCCYA